MPRLRRDHQAGREDDADRARRADPADPAQRVLALQRAAGNRAVTSLLQRFPEEPAASWRPRTSWDRFWGTPGRPAKPPPAAAIAALDAVLHGGTPSLEGLDDFEAIAVTQAMITMLANDKHVTYWREAGCVELDGDDVYLRRPAPTEAVAGWLGFAPTLPQYVPVIPREFATVGDRSPLPPPQPTDAALKTAEALTIAALMLQRKLQGHHYLAAGLADPAQQAIAVKVLALLCGRIHEVAHAANYGMAVEQPDGTTTWVRPAPAFDLARRLGIGPD